MFHLAGTEMRVWGRGGCRGHSPQQAITASVYPEGNRDDQDPSTSGGKGRGVLGSSGWKRGCTPKKNGIQQERVQAGRRDHCGTVQRQALRDLDSTPVGTPQSPRGILQCDPPIRTRPLDSDPGHSATGRTHDHCIHFTLPCMTPTLERTPPFRGSLHTPGPGLKEALRTPLTEKLRPREVKECLRSP